MVINHLLTGMILQVPNPIGSMGRIKISIYLPVEPKWGPPVLIEVWALIWRVDLQK